MTHYALAHPSRHFELHSATQALLIAPAVASTGDRPQQIFGRHRRADVDHGGVEIDFTRAGPRVAAMEAGERLSPPDPAFGISASPCRSCRRTATSIYVFVNHCSSAIALVLHALTEADRNIIRPLRSPVVLLLFLDMPPQEVDVNVHLAKTEVRFRQPSFVHDFIRIRFAPR